MKRMKFIALTIAMLFLLSACNSINVTEVAVVGDEAMLKPEFMYYLQMGKNEASQKAQEQGQLISEDADWNSVMIDGVTAAEHAKDAAVKSVKSIMTMEALGKEAGYELTEKDIADLNTQREQLIEGLGGRYAYEQTLTEMGIPASELDTILERSIYANAYMTQYTEGNTSFDPTEEEIKEKYNGEYVYVRHILISNQEPTDELDGEEIAEPVDYDALAKAEAEEILEKLAQGANFVTLMNEYSDDGRDESGKLSSDGYIMTDNGQMVPEFEEAAMKLEIGAYTTELVETAYGYHILMRYDLPTQGDNYDSVISDIKTEMTADKLNSWVDERAEELGLIINHKFIDNLKIKMEG